MEDFRNNLSKSSDELGDLKSMETSAFCVAQSKKLQDLGEIHSDRTNCFLSRMLECR